MIQIGLIQQEDLETLALLYFELTGERTDDERMADTFQRLQSNPDYILLGARRGNQLVGSLMGIVCYEMVGQCKPFMIIENVIVSNKYRRMGIGRALMGRIEEIAMEKGCSVIQFVSSAYRKEAHRFYESVGYGLDVVQGFRKYLSSGFVKKE
ncbi:MAG: GNAT family N-acetyltransferase [Firmicutes bacterium]|nr:GNAT family N-acetyltransferase [Bacillota bacterium]